MALQKTGISLEAQGSDAFFAAIKSANEAVAAMGAGALKAAGGVDAFAEAAARAAKVADLEGKLGTQRKELGILQKELEQTAAKYGEGSTQAQRKALAVDKLTNSIQSTERALASEQQALVAAAQATEKAADATQEVGQAADKATPQVKDLGQTAEHAGKGFNSLREVATGALREIGAGLVEMAAEGARAFGAFTVDSVKMAGDFDAGLRTLGAVAGDSMADAGVSLDTFREKALQLGADTKYSADEALTAMTELAKGGVPITEVLGGATEAVLNLAAAGGVELGPAAEIVAKNLSIWSREGVTAADVTNLIAQAANASTVGVEELANGMANAQGTAQSLGLEYKDFVTTMAVLAPAFSSSQEAGTSFKNFLVRLQPQTKPARKAMQELGLLTEEGASKFFDAQGAYVGGAKAADLLAQATAGLSDAKRTELLQIVFGNDGMGAANQLLQEGAAGYERVAGAMDAAGTAAAQAAKMNEGFNAIMDALSGSIDTVKIRLGTALLPLLSLLVTAYIVPAVNAVGDLVQAFTDLAAGNTFGFFTTLAGILMPLNQGLGSFVASLALASNPMASLVLGIDSALPGFATFTSIVQRIPAALALFGQTLGTVWAILSGNSSLVDTVALTGLLSGIFGGEIAANITTFISTALAPLFQIIAANIVPILSTLAGILAGPVVSAVFGAIGAFIAIVAPIAAAVSAGALLYSAWQSNFLGIRDIAGQAFGALPGIIGSALSGLQGVVSGVLGAIQGFWDTHGASITASATTAWGQIVAGVSAYTAGLWSLISAVFGQIASFLSAHGGEISGFLATTWSQISAIIGGAVQLIGTLVGGALALVALIINTHGAEIQTILGAVWSNISTIITTVLAVIQGVIQTALAVMQGDWAGAWNIIKETCATVVLALVTIIQNNLTIIITIFQGVIDDVLGVLAQSVSSFASAGVAIVQGIIRGVQSAASSLFSAVANLAREAYDAAMAALFASSPSQLFADGPGEAITTGMAKGVTNATPALTSAVSGAVDAALRAANAGFSGGTLVQSGNIASLFSNPGGLSTSRPDLSIVTGDTLALKDALLLANDSATYLAGGMLKLGDTTGLSAAKLREQEEAVGRATEGLQRHIVAGLKSETIERRQTAQTELLEKQTMYAVDAFLKLNPAIDGAGLAALVTSGQLDQMTAELIKQEQETREAERALAAFDEMLESVDASLVKMTANLNAFSTAAQAIDRIRGMADAARAVGDLAGDDNTDDRRDDLRDAVKEEEEYQKKRAEILAASDFEEDYYNEAGELVMGRRSKLAALEAEYSQDGMSATERRIAAEQALAAEIERVTAALALQAQAQADLAAAREEASRIRAMDQELGNEYNALRNQQILELAGLERERIDLAARAAAGDAGAAAQLAALDAQIALIKEAHTLEIQAFRDRAREQIIAGVAAANGIEVGMVEQTPALLAYVDDLMQQIIAATQGALGIASPSKVFAKMGKQTLWGFAKPFTDGNVIGDVLRSVDSAMGKVIMGAGQALGQALPAATTIRPAAMGGGGDTSYHYGGATTYQMDARGSNWSRPQLEGIVRGVVDRTARSADGTRRTGGYGRRI